MKRLLHFLFSGKGGFAAEAIWMAAAIFFCAFLLVCLMVAV
jgi:hypothetical protein